MKIEVSHTKKDVETNIEYLMSQKKDIKPQNYLQNIWGNMRQTATQPIRSIGFSLAISRHFLIATLPGTNELPLNMDGWNTSPFRKSVSAIFQGQAVSFS